MPAILPSTELTGTVLADAEDAMVELTLRLECLIVAAVRPVTDTVDDEYATLDDDVDDEAIAGRR